MALPPLIVIGGATATGKTTLSITLAERFGAEIISADSRQVYRGMDIGTAKVTAADRARVPHHGLDLVDPDEPFSVAAFARHAGDVLPAIASRGRVAILAGGTGLYLRALGRGLPLEAETTDPTLRAALEERLTTGGVEPLAAELLRLAPTVAASIDLANPRRVVRALERATLVGDRPPEPARGYPAPVLWFGVRVERPQHRERIAARAAGQFSGGLVEEAAALRSRYPPETGAFSAFGYREAMRVVAGESTLAEALAETIQRTHVYGKRQETWFRSEPGMTWLDGAQDPFARAAPLVEQFLTSASATRSS
jgi:tRNA dimethylallyltransferase